MSFNTLISEAKGSGDSATSYARFLPEPLAKLASKTQSVSISMGHAVEHLASIGFYKSQSLSYAEISAFFSGSLSLEDDTVKFFTYSNFTKCQWAKDRKAALRAITGKPDFFIVYNYDERILIPVECKLGHQFDTKKLEGESNAMETFCAFLKTNVAKNISQVCPVIASASEIQNDSEFYKGFKNKFIHKQIEDSVPSVWRLVELLEYFGADTTQLKHAFKDAQIKNGQYVCKTVIQYMYENPHMVDEQSMKMMRRLVGVV